MEEEFDYQSFEADALDKLKKGIALEGKDGILAPLIKRLVEASLEGEMDAHLSIQEAPNRRNGKTSKRVKTGYGTVDISTPRDRNSNFNSALLPKLTVLLP